MVAADPGEDALGEACQVGAGSSGSRVSTLTPQQLKARLADSAADDAGVLLVDVREAGERAIVTISGATAVPLGSILDGSGLDAIPRDRPVVLYCRSGVRSEQAAVSLLAAGYRDVAHLSGGVLAWIDEVEPSLTRY